MSNVILHVSDWNYKDKYYEAPVELLKEFRVRVKKDGIEAMDGAWQWWTSQVDYDEDGKKPIKYMLVNMNLDLYFFDYNNDQESIEEWNFE